MPKLNSDRIVLRYSPDKGNAYGHATVPRPVPKISAHLRHFFEQFTISHGPTRVSLQVFGPTTFDTHDHSEECSARARDCFGPPSTEGDFSIVSPSGSSTPMNKTWKLEDKDFSKALDFLNKGHPWPKQLLGPVTLMFSYDFIWRDPRTGRAFPDQESGHHTSDGRLVSSFLVQLQRTSFIQPDLMLPYDLSDERLYDLLGAVSPSLPFAMRLKHFRRGLPMKKELGFSYRKIDAALSCRLSQFTK